MAKEKDIKHSRLKQIVNDYNEIQSWLAKHKKVLEILKKDHELLTGEDPYTLHFAVDFHEIHEIVFPLGSEVMSKGFPNDDWIHRKVVSQSGRLCLFYEVEKVPVLLPPYRDEFKDFIFWLKTEFKEITQQYLTLSGLKDSIKTALQDEGIEFGRQDGQFEMSDKSYAKIISFIKKHFFQLNILLMGGYTEEFSILKTLYSDDRFETVSDRWSEYSGFIDEESGKVPDSWHEFIRKFRKEDQIDVRPKEKDIKRAKDIRKNNSRDLLALHLIKALNNKFKEEDKKEIVLLVSDSKIFERLLNSTLYDNGDEKKIGGIVKTATGEEIEICRNTDVFHTYLLIKEERDELRPDYEECKEEFTTRPTPTAWTNRVTLINVEDDLRKMKIIEAFDKEIDRIIDLCNRNGGDCQKSGDSSENDTCKTCKNTHKVIKDFQRDRKSLESLALAERFDIYAKIYKHYQQTVSFDEGAKQILRLLQDDEKISQKINKKLEEIREHINLGFEELSDKSNIREPGPDVLRIPRWNSFRIKTYMEEIDEIIRKIQRSIRRHDQDKFSDYFSDLKNKKKQLNETKQLKYLSSSLFAAAYEKYDLALYFLETGLKFTPETMSLRKEYKYLETIIYSNKKKHEKALRLCEDLLVKYPDDFRFPYFCGYIILTGKDDNALDGCRFTQAVKYCRKSLDMLKRTDYDEEDLEVYLLNNLIYGLSKVGTSEAIEEAEKHIATLIERTNPDSEWGEHIWHTVGYVSFRKTELLKEENENYLDIINEAIKCFENADNKADGKNPIIKNDLEKAKDLKNSCPTA